MDAYDLLVIGTGTAAQAAAGRVRKAGRSVAMIDHRAFGGTCALRGCDPKRMLISCAEAIDAETRMRGHGVIGEARIDWRDLMMFKRSRTDVIPRSREREFAENAIEAFHGLAGFTGPDAVVVEGQELRARHILIAAGARPVPLTLPAKSTPLQASDFLSLMRYRRTSS
jgi:glutathione reductase (NADPH)